MGGLGEGKESAWGPLTGAAGVAAASGSSAPGAGARSPLLPLPPAAVSPQWLGLGLGGSPESGLSRTPSPFFFVSTSSGTSCRLSRPTMAVRVAGPQKLSAEVAVERGPRGAHTRAPGQLPSRPPSLPRRPRAVRVSPAAARPAPPRPRPRQAPPPPGPASRTDRAARRGARGRCAPAVRRPRCAALFPPPSPSGRRTPRTGGAERVSQPTGKASRPGKERRGDNARALALGAR
jgi:hypothetical protein